jgi:hypothetical protein
MERQIHRDVRSGTPATMEFRWQRATGSPWSSTIFHDLRLFVQNDAHMEATMPGERGSTFYIRVIISSGPIEDNLGSIKLNWLQHPSLVLLLLESIRALRRRVSHD